MTLFGLGLKTRAKMVDPISFDIKETSPLRAIRAMEAQAWDEGAHWALRNYTEIPKSVAKGLNLDNDNPYRTEDTGD